MRKENSSLKKEVAQLQQVEAEQKTTIVGLTDVLKVKDERMSTLTMQVDDYKTSLEHMQLYINQTSQVKREYNATRVDMNLQELYENLQTTNSDLVVNNAKMETQVTMLQSHVATLQENARVMST